jgi:pimeloyl-ACP methyl ester carboxylesterase
VVDEVADVRSLADELGFDRFGVGGGSGGGPHALACAALLADRVVRAICDVGVAPLGTRGLEKDAWLAGMDPENVREFGWALAGEDVLTRELQALQVQLEERARVDPSTVLQDFDMSESDRVEMARPEMMQIIGSVA